jgi:hypothetical protein
MAKNFPGRFTAQISGQIKEPFVFLILGVRINRPLQFWKWFPAIFAALPMLYSQIRYRKTGFLGGQVTYFWPGMGLTQYWNSFGDLEWYARNKKHPHLRAWRHYNKFVGADGSVGLWHEAFLIKPGCYEVVYENMPLFGLAAATKQVPLGEGSGMARLLLGEEEIPAIPTIADVLQTG